jgi:hypothetical protein
MSALLLLVSTVAAAQDLGTPTDQTGMDMATATSEPELSPVPSSPEPAALSNESAVPTQTAIASDQYDPYGVMGGQVSTCPMLSGTAMPGTSGTSMGGMSGMGMSGMSGTNMSGMSGMTMGDMTGMGMGGMSGMNMGGMAGMNMADMTGMNTGSMAGMNMAGIDGVGMSFSSLWYTNPWWLLGWVILILLAIAILIGALLAVLWIIRRNRPAASAETT